MKKIIKLTESDLTRIIRRVISEQSGKKCFDQKTFDKLKKEGGYIATKKIESGDTWSKIQRISDDNGDFILKHNKFCDVKNPKIGEMIVYSTLPNS